MQNVILLFISSVSDIVLETKIMVLRRFDDKNKVGLLVFVKVLKQKSWSWVKNLQNFKNFNYS